jgi:hypothetical protein
MNLKVLIIFVLATAILHIILHKMEALKKENDALKNGNVIIQEESTIKEKKAKKISKKKVSIKDIKEARDAELEDIIPETKEAVKPEEQIKDDELRADLLDFIKQSKTNRLVNSVKPENEVNPAQETMKLDYQKYEEEPGYLHFGEEVERELKVDEYDQKTADEENDNITLINADPNQKHNRIADQYESTANKEFRALKVDTWVYQNEKLMNGGKADGIGGHDPNGICNFAAL